MRNRELTPREIHRRLTIFTDKKISEQTKMKDCSNFLTTLAYNNNGAVLIEKGDYLGAISSLSLALKAAKNSMAEDYDEGDLQQEVLSFSVDDLMAKGPLQESHIEEGFYVYDRPIRIPEVWGVSKDERSSTERLPQHPRVVVCSAISTFNLALAHHLCALKNNTNSEALLNKSTKLYEYGLQVQQGAYYEDDREREDDQEADIFSLAMLNNLADVHRRLQNSEIAKAYSETILQVLLSIIDTNDSATETLDAFYQNTFFYLISSRGVNTAAAA